MEGPTHAIIPDQTEKTIDHMSAKADMSWNRTIFGKPRNGFTSGFITTLYALRITIHLQVSLGCLRAPEVIGSIFNLRIADSCVGLLNDKTDFNVE